MLQTKNSGKKDGNKVVECREENSLLDIIFIRKHIHMDFAELTFKYEVVLISFNVSFGLFNIDFVLDWWLLGNVKSVYQF